MIGGATFKSTYNNAGHGSPSTARDTDARKMTGIGGVASSAASSAL